MGVNAIHPALNRPGLPWLLQNSLSLSKNAPPSFPLLTVLEKIESNRILVVAMASRSSDSIAFNPLSAWFSCVSWCRNCVAYPDIISGDFLHGLNQITFPTDLLLLLCRNYFTFLSFSHWIAVSVCCVPCGSSTEKPEIISGVCWSCEPADHPQPYLSNA